MLLAACLRLGAGVGRTAVDLGCGDGTDALVLLDRGWSVLAVDIEPAGLALLRARIPPASAGKPNATARPTVAPSTGTPTTSWPASQPDTRSPATNPPVGEDTSRHERALSVRDSMYKYSDRAAAC